MQVIIKDRVPPLPAERLEAISKVLADTETGLTGSQIVDRRVVDPARYNAGCEVVAHELPHGVLDETDPDRARWPGC